MSWLTSDGGNPKMRTLLQEKLIKEECKVLCPNCFEWNFLEENEVICTLCQEHLQFIEVLVN
jgi:hypothetical protein